MQRWGKALDGVQWGGASSGAFAALIAALKMSPSQAREIYDTLADMARSYGVFNKMSIYHAIVLEKMLPDGGSEYQALRGRLHVSVTRALWKNEVCIALIPWWCMGAGAFADCWRALLRGSSSASGPQIVSCGISCTHRPTSPST